MFRWMWRSKLGPIRLLVLMLGKDLADINIDKEATYRMVVIPKAAAERPKLIDVCKQIFQCSKEEAASAVDTWSRVKNGELSIHSFQLFDMFTLDKLSKKDVLDVRKICEKQKCFRIEYDELQRLEDEASWVAKQKILKQDTEVLLQKQSKGRSVTDLMEDEMDEPGFAD